MCTHTHTGFHVSNVVFHAVACVAAAAVIMRVFGRRRRMLAVVAALVFAVHPVHVEVVSNVTGRAETLSAILMLAATYCYMCGRGLGADARPSTACNGKCAALVALSFLLVAVGALFKETSIVTPALFVACVTLSLPLSCLCGSHCGLLRASDWRYAMQQSQAGTLGPLPGLHCSTASGIRCAFTRCGWWSGLPCRCCGCGSSSLPAGTRSTIPSTWLPACLLAGHGELTTPVADADSTTR